MTPGSTPINPTDYVRIFDLLYVRLSCLCLIDAVPLAAQEAKALEDLNSAFYTDVDTGLHLAPWPLRTLVVRLQTIGFGDPRRAVMSYYELTREARSEIARAGRAHDHSAAETWKRRLAELGLKVAGALIEMDDLAGAASHLASLPDAQVGEGRLAMSRALLWLHLGDVDAARRCMSQGASGGETGERVVDALADMADGEYDTALTKWQALRDEMSDNEIEDEMVGVNLAVCLLYTGRMSEVWFSLLTPPLLLYPTLIEKEENRTPKCPMLTPLITIGPRCLGRARERGPDVAYTAIQSHDDV
jgi:hypothetical protein